MSPKIILHKFSAIQEDGNLKTHITSAYLAKLILPMQNPLETMLHKNISYIMHYDRCEAKILQGVEECLMIVSFQHLKNGENHAIARPFNPQKPTKGN